MEAKLGKRVATMNVGFASISFGIFFFAIIAAFPSPDRTNRILGIILSAVLMLVGVAYVVYALFFLRPRRPATDHGHRSRR